MPGSTKKKRKGGCQSRTSRCAGDRFRRSAEIGEEIRQTSDSRAFHGHNRGEKTAIQKLYCPVLLLLLLSAAAPAQRSDPLFYIEHSINRNKLYYEVRRTASGSIDCKRPVEAHWIMWAKDSTGGTREDLSLLESKEAYGFTVKPDSPAGRFEMRIVSLPDRPLKVDIRNDVAVAETAIDGRSCSLAKVFVKVGEHTLVHLPTVTYVELFGNDLETGQPRSEKVLGR